MKALVLALAISLPAAAEPRTHFEWGVGAGVTSLALFGASLATFQHAKSLTLSGPCVETDCFARVDRGAGWRTASNGLLIGSAALAALSAAFFVVKF